MMAARSHLACYLLLALLGRCVLVSSAQELFISGTSTVTADIQQILSTLVEASRPQISAGYRSIGTGPGLEELISHISTGAPHTITFSGIPVPAANYSQVQGQVLQAPVAIAKVSVWHSVPVGMYSGNINLTACLLARIFSGEIKAWDHADIKAVNPSLIVPPQTPIKVIGRTDVSPSMMAFTNYMNMSCASAWTLPAPQPMWPASNWAAGTLLVSSTSALLNMLWPASSSYQAYAISFADYGVATRFILDNMASSIQEVALQQGASGSGAWVTAAAVDNAAVATILTPASAPAITSNWDTPSTHTQFLSSPTGWPITLPLMALFPTNSTALADSGSLMRAVLDFMWSTEGQGLFASNFHVPLTRDMSSSLVQQVHASLVISDTTAWVFENSSAVLPDGGARNVFSAFRSSYLTTRVNVLQQTIANMSARIQALDSKYADLLAGLQAVNINQAKIASLEALATIALVDRQRINDTIMAIAEAESKAETANQIAIAGVVLAVVLAVVALIIAVVYLVRTKKLDQKYSKYLPLGVKARFEDGGDI